MVHYHHSALHERVTAGAEAHPSTQASPPQRLPSPGPRSGNAGDLDPTSDKGAQAVCEEALMQPWQQQQAAQQAAQQAQQAAQRAAQQAQQAVWQQQQAAMQQQQRLRQRRAGRPRSAAAGCARILFGIVAVVLVVYVVYVLLLGHHF